MKSNSPNQVDGDVQALIADCQAEIAELEKHLTTWGEEWSPYLQSKLKRQQIALAALTAEPDGFRVRNKKISQDNEIYDDRFTGEKCINNTTQPEDYEIYAIYRKPPADSVRHMLMPKVVGEIPAYGEVISKAHLIHALRQQGIEVKND